MEPLFDASPILQWRLATPSLARRDRNTMLHRLWPGGSLKCVAGKAPRNLRRHTARVLMIDEADAIEVSAEDDPRSLASPPPFRYLSEGVCLMRCAVAPMFEYIWIFGI